jgi:hypothetical protein
VFRIRLDFIADSDPAFYLNADPDPDQGAQPMQIRILVKTSATQKIGF